MKKLIIILFLISLAFSNSLTINMTLASEKWGGAQQPYYITDLPGVYFEHGDAIRVRNLTVTNLENFPIPYIHLSIFNVNGSFRTENNSEKILDFNITNLAPGETRALDISQCGFYSSQEETCWIKLLNGSDFIRAGTVGPFLMSPEIKFSEPPVSITYGWVFYLNGYRQFLYEIKTSSELNNIWANRQMLKQQEQSNDNLESILENSIKQEKENSLLQWIAIVLAILSPLMLYQLERIKIEKLEQINFIVFLIVLLLVGIPIVLMIFFPDLVLIYVVVILLLFLILTVIIFLSAYTNRTELNRHIDEIIGSDYIEIFVIVFWILSMISLIGIFLQVTGLLGAQLENASRQADIKNLCMIFSILLYSTVLALLKGLNRLLIKTKINAKEKTEFEKQMEIQNQILESSRGNIEEQRIFGDVQKKQYEELHKLAQSLEVRKENDDRRIEVQKNILEILKMILKEQKRQSKKHRKK